MDKYVDFSRELKKKKEQQKKKNAVGHEDDDDTNCRGVTRNDLQSLEKETERVRNLLCSG